MPHPEAYAVSIFFDSACMSVKCRDLTLEKAKAFARAYNCDHDDHCAVVIRQANRQLAVRQRWLSTSENVSAATAMPCCPSEIARAQVRAPCSCRTYGLAKFFASGGLHDD